MTFIIKYYGITQDPETNDYMLIMEYASGGNLHNYLNTHFANIKWNTKLAILCQISDGYLFIIIIIIYYYLIIIKLLNYLTFLFILDLKLFIMKISYIEIFIVGMSYH